MLGPGGIFLATDSVSSKGHRTRAVDGPVTLLMITVADAVDLDAWTVRD